MSLQALPHDERQIITALLDAADAAGLRVSVYDGEEWAVVSSDNRALLSLNIGTTDATTLRFRDPKRRDADGNLLTIGSVFLVHGNGRDVIADHSDNAETEALVAPAMALADSY
jgi:hypothetical protein